MAGDWPVCSAPCASASVPPSQQQMPSGLRWRMPSTSARASAIAGAPSWLRAPAIAAIAAGSYRTKAAHQIRASGYVVHTLEAALWAFYNSNNFRDGALLAVNLGQDADTTGAVYGQLAQIYRELGNLARWRA